MKNELYIDGQGASNFGVHLQQYGLKQLVQMPAFKSIDTTDWAEEDGIEADLSNPVLNNRKIQLQFAIEDYFLTQDFFDLLNDSSKHTYTFTPLQKSYDLRVVNCTTFSIGRNLGKFTITLNDDEPQIPIGQPYALGASEVKQRLIEIDNIDFSQFGVFILKGTIDEIVKLGTMKTALTVNSKRVPGVIYDSGQAPRRKTRDIKLKLLIDAPNINVFWERWYALFATILAAGEHTLYSSQAMMSCVCYYKSNTVSKFDVLTNGRVWCEFTLTLTVIKSETTIPQDTLLATESGEIVIVDTHTAIIIEN